MPQVRAELGGPSRRAGVSPAAAGLNQTGRVNEWLWLAALRALWVSLPWSVGGLVGRALEETGGAFGTTATVGAWVAWSLGLTALLAPHTVSLTAVRSLAPAVLAAACWATAEVGPSAGAAMALSVAAVATIGVMSPLVGARFIDATSYGYERRLALRAPAAVLTGALVPTWALTVGGAAAGPLLWAAGHWVLGPVVSVTGWLLAAAGVRAMHGLARRWLVYVPAGLVLHDRLALTEPVLLRRPVIASLGPAPVGSEARDCTAGAGGLVLELRLLEPVAVTPARSGGETEKVTALLVVPTRPAAVLAEARRHRITGAAG